MAFLEKTENLGRKTAVAGLAGVIAGSLLNLQRLFGLGANITGVGAVVWGTSKLLKNALS